MAYPDSSDVANGNDATATQYNNLRSDVLAHSYVLWEASGVTITFSGGTMSTAEKEAASWTFTTGGSFTDTGNSYDGDTGTYDTVNNLNDGLTAKIDFGADVILDEIRVLLGYSAGDLDSFTVKVSDTGAFAGEEDTLSVSVSHVSGLHKTEFDTTQSRYWQVYIQKGGSSGVAVYEWDFINACTLAIQGVPWGCEVELFDGAVSKETQISESILRPGIVEFTTADIADVDKVTVTKPDGSTAWLEFTSQSFSSGDLYVLMKGQ